MKSTYDVLGKYIRPIDVRNVEGKEENLLGVTTQKYFMPSIANTVGTDFSKYKVVRRGQFTYVPDTSRRGDRIAIALLQNWDEGLVSNIYTVFEVTDESKLLPEYLMLWFKRPEFDRYARFKSHGSVREVFDWDELCGVVLPVPDIEVQRSIVRAYNVIEGRIRAKRELNDNLEATATAIFNDMFLGTNGGGTTGKLADLMDFKNGKSRPSGSGQIPVYGGNGVLSYANVSNATNAVIIGRVGAYCGSLYIEFGDCWISDNAIYAKSKLCTDEYFDYFLLSSLSVGDHHIGTGQPLLTQGILNTVETPITSVNDITTFNSRAKPLYGQVVSNRLEIKALNTMQSVLLANLAR